MENLEDLRELPLHVYDYNDDQLLEIIEVLYDNIMTLSNFIDDDKSFISKFLDNILDYPNEVHELSDVDSNFCVFNAGFDDKTGDVLWFEPSLNRSYLFKLTRGDGGKPKFKFSKTESLLMGKNLKKQISDELKYQEKHRC